jgi:hypothetical protein
VRPLRRFVLALGLLAGCRAASERVQGTWERTDAEGGGQGQLLRFEGDRLTHVFGHGGKPMAGPFTIVESSRSALVIEPMIELPDGRLLRADRQRIEFVDDDTITMKNATNGSGGTYERR